MPPLNADNPVPLDLGELERRLETEQGPTYWRSLEELAQTEKFQEQLHREFPVDATEWTNPVSRRRFLTLMGASLALAGMAGCSRPVGEKILPYIREPEGMVPGKPLFFATAFPLAGVAIGLLVESHMGRPTKVEGNPDHPGSRGATDALAQASILTLYDPDREQNINNLGKLKTWEEAISALGAAVKKLKQGQGFRILSGAIGSPTLLGQLDDLLAKHPEARWHIHEPAVSEAAIEGAKLAFNPKEDVQPTYRLDQADVIVALDSDILNQGPGHLVYASQWASRRPGAKADAVVPAKMNRLYSAESTFSCTGAVADHHLSVRSDLIEAIARAIAEKVGVSGVESASVPQKFWKWVEAVVNDLRFEDGNKDKKRSPGTTLVVAGSTQPPVVHALAYAINAALGNIGKTVNFTRRIDRPEADSKLKAGTISELTADMKAGKVEVLLILGGNPVFTAPNDLDFADALSKVALRVRMGLYQDETSALCHWHLPEAHYLESWGDARAFDGTASIIQPLIAPLYKGRSPLELISELFSEMKEKEIDKSALTPYELVRAYWKKWWEGPGKKSGSYESFWKTSLHNGVIAGTTFESVSVSLREGFVKSLPAERKPSQEMEVVFRPDPVVFDGQFANNGWLQELPQPLTRITWDNAVLLSPKTFDDLGLSLRFGGHGGEHGEAIVDMVTLTVEGQELMLPAWKMPGHADNSLTVYFGQGRTRGGKVCKGVGFNVYTLRTSKQPWQATVHITKTGEKHTLACTQGHHNMEDRALVRETTLAKYKQDPHAATKSHEHGHAKHGAEEHKGEEHKAEEHKEEPHLRPLTLLDGPPKPYDGHKWGMSINLSSCIGCSACVVACQAENNIPVVGKDQVTRGREMHWLRIDRYFKGDPYAEVSNIEVLHQPVPCQQCENAPCEQVCPVAATVHSFDGLNDMVYNRCVGTRYCSNNCPYKVRRFNFLAYADFDTPSLKLGRNPEVTVRSRGVMEKCTYCVQRIRAAEIVSQREYRPLVNGQKVSMIRDGEVLTACQAVCPTGAIVFGDLTGPDATGNSLTTSRVTKLKNSPLNYNLLDGLNTQPRTTYLAAVRNPNPELSERHGD
jgi:molybdopterin-containing oxidoreductase family iron-sulfur binding subunit